MTEPAQPTPNVAPPTHAAPPPSDVPAAPAHAGDAALDGQLQEARAHLGADIDALADEVQRELGVDLRAWVRPELVERFVDLVSPVATAIRIIVGGAIGAAAWITFCLWMLHDNVGTVGAVIGGGLGLLALPFVTVAIASAAGIHVAAGHIAALTHAGRELATQGVEDAAAILAVRDDPPPPARAARLLLRGTLLVVVLPCAEVGIRRALRFVGRPVAWAVRQVGSLVVRKALPPRLAMKSAGPSMTDDDVDSADTTPDAPASVPGSAAPRAVTDPSAAARLTTAMTTLGDHLDRVGARAPMTFRRWTWIGAGLITGLSAMGIALIALLF